MDDIVTRLRHEQSILSDEHVWDIMSNDYSVMSMCEQHVALVATGERGHAWDSEGAWSP